MNKLLNFLILFLLILILFLFTFSHAIYYSHFYYAIKEDHIIGVFNFIDFIYSIDTTSVDTSSDITSDNTSVNRENRVFTSSYYSNSVNYSSLLKKNKVIRMFKELKHDIKGSKKLFAHKIKVFDRTLSWFFKGSKPGGGRGL